jgi:hypothetical protein
MANSYSLTVINNSELDNPEFAVFATLPLQADYESVGLAWLVQQINAGNRYVFTWDITWGFVWTATGTREGYQWSATGSLPANPLADGECAVTFDYNGDFVLTPSTGTPDGSTLWIKDTTTIPLPKNKPSSVGISLDGSAACVTDAGPNLHQIFTLHPTYYIDAGNYVQGQMVDGTSVTDFQVLEYAAGITALTATLDEDNTWTVEPSSSIDFSEVGRGSAEVGGGRRGACYRKTDCEGTPFKTNVTEAKCRNMGGKSWQSPSGSCFEQ